MRRHWKGPVGPTGSPPLRLHAPETGRERQEWEGGREASEARRPNPLQTAALALHEVLSNENCHCKKKKKKSGERKGERDKNKDGCSYENRRSLRGKTGAPSTDLNKQIYWWGEISINNNQAQLARSSCRGLITLSSPFLIEAHTHMHTNEVTSAEFTARLPREPDRHHFCRRGSVNQYTSPVPLVQSVCW